jgi:hypothetical protein
MIGYVQWTTDPASGWEQLSILSNNDWRKLPSKSEPAGGETIDTTKGWVQAVMCQGVTLMSMDHYALLPDGGALEMYGWNDDPVDWPTPWGIIWRFMLPTVDGMLEPPQVNTRQSCAVYGDGHPYPTDGRLTTSVGPWTFHPWSDFPQPQANLTRHGIWVPSDCENCPHFEDDHGRATTGHACDFGDCTGYASLHARHKDAVTAEQHGWREWVGAG